MPNSEYLNKNRCLLRMTAIGVCLLAACVASANAQATASATASGPARPAQCRVVLVGSMSGSPLLAKRYQDWLKRFHAVLSKAGVPAGNIVLLSGDKTFKDAIVTGPATTQSVCKAVAQIGGQCDGQDQFVLIMIGQGSTSDALPAFVLPGQDMTADELAKALSSVSARTQVVLNFSNSSGSFIKPLAVSGRINIAATSPDESAQSVLAEFFLRALEAAPKDDGVTLLEALNQSAYQTALWISRQRLLEDGSWMVTGKQSVELFKKLYTGGDKDSGGRILAESSDANVADPIVEIVPPTEAEAAKEWDGRRLVDEHAMLEDCGQDTGVSPLRGPKGYDPIVPSKPDSPGSLASKVVLGKPRPPKTEK
jgi:hypothetical protein